MEKERTAVLRKEEDELKKVQLMKELAATQAEIEAVAQVENISNCSLNVENVLKLEDGVNVQKRMEQYVESQQVSNPNKGLVSANEDMSQSVTELNGINQQNSDERLNCRQEAPPNCYQLKALLKMSPQQRILRHRSRFPHTKIPS